MSVLSRSESDPEPAGGASGELEEEEEEEDEEEDDDNDRRAGVVRSERKGDMRGVPVRVRVVTISPVTRGRIGRETRGTIVRKKGKRGSIRRIMTVVQVL